MGALVLDATTSLLRPVTVKDADDSADAPLVAHSRAGDRDAFGELVRRHERRVFRLAGRFFRRREDVEEAAQETFLRAWRKLGSYRADAPFEHWLTRVCLNCCYEILRQRPPESLELPADLAAPESNASAALEAERLLARLPAEDRFLLLMLHGEGWSVAEIAHNLGWTQVNVKVRAHRARLRLRRELSREAERGEHDAHEPLA